MKNRFSTYSAAFPGSKRVRRFAFVIFHHSKSTECLDFHLQGQSVPYLRLSATFPRSNWSASAEAQPASGSTLWPHACCRACGQPVPPCCSGWHQTWAYTYATSTVRLRKVFLLDWFIHRGQSWPLNEFQKRGTLSAFQVDFLNNANELKC